MVFTSFLKSAVLQESLYTGNMQGSLYTNVRHNRAIFTDTTFVKRHFQIEALQIIQRMKPLF